MIFSQPIDLLEKLVRDDPNVIYEAFIHECEKEHSGFRDEFEMALSVGFPEAQITAMAKECFPLPIAGVVIKACLWKRNMLITRITGDDFLFSLPGHNTEM